jgi:hypothetical protein
MPREPKVDLRVKRILSRKNADELWQVSKPMELPRKDDSMQIRDQQHGSHLSLLRSQNIEGSTSGHSVHAFNAHAFGNQRLVQRGMKELML